MTDNYEWTSTKKDLHTVLVELGYPAELGDEIAKNLGSPKAMQRMISYLQNVRPESIELVVDEMLAIKSEIDTWKAKKASQEANARYTELLNDGL